MRPRSQTTCTLLYSSLRSSLSLISRAIVVFPAHSFAFRSASPRSVRERDGDLSVGRLLELAGNDAVLEFDAVVFHVGADFVGDFTVEASEEDGTDGDGGVESCGGRGGGVSLERSECLSLRSSRLHT